MERDERHFPVLSEHDGANAHEADSFGSDLLGEGVDDGGELIGLVNAARDAGAGLTGEIGSGQAEDVAEGGDDEIGFHEAGHFGAEVVGTEGGEVAGSADEEEESDGFDEGFEGFVGRAGWD